MFEMLMAGVYIRVNNRYPFIENQCKDWIVSQSKKEPDMIVSATEEEMIQERTSESFSKGYCESICIYRNIAKQLYRFDAFVFHASVWMKKDTPLLRKVVWGRVRIHDTGWRHLGTGLM